MSFDHLYDMTAEVERPGRDGATDTYGHAIRSHAVLRSELPCHIWAAPRLQEDDTQKVAVMEYWGMISLTDMPVSESDVVVAVSYANGERPFGDTLELEAAVSRGAVY